MFRSSENILRYFGQCWQRLFLTDLIYKAIAFVFLAPLTAVLFRILVAMSGNPVLADQDILFFFLAPIGWLCLILVGALRLSIVALEMAALIAILATTSVAGHPVSVPGALRFVTTRAWPVMQVAARMIGWTLLLIAPFVIVTAAVYFVLLTDYDINYYLKVKPPAFYTALSIAAIIATLLAAVLLRLVTGWFFALPLVLLESVPPATALRESWERTHSCRRKLFLWILIWLLGTTGLSALLIWLVVQLGRQIVPGASASLGLLTTAVGGMLLIWALVNLIVNLLATTSFATMLFNLYRDYGSGGKIEIDRLDLSPSKAEASAFRFSTGRVLAASILGLAISISVGVLVLNTVRVDDDLSIIAHRGASHDAPENTLAAVKKAIEDGADWVEIDVQETADGEVVVFHDADFMKLAGLDLKIWEATMGDIEKIDIGSWFSPEFKDQRVPKLSEVLQLCKGKVNLIIELKYYGHDVRLEQSVVNIVEENSMASNAIFMSLDKDAVKKMKSLRPSWTAGLLMSVSTGNLKQIEADFLAVNADFIDRPFVRAVHTLDKQIFAWTVNDPVSMSTLVGKGVDGLITDKPGLARSVLERRSQMNLTERLVLDLAQDFGVPTNISGQ